MAIVPMQKVRLLVHRDDVDQALLVLQKHGAMQFTEVSLADLEKQEAVFPHANLLPRVQHAAQFLAPYAPKVGLFQSLREGTRSTFSEAALAKRAAETDDIEAIVSDVEALQVEFAEKNEAVRRLEERQQVLTSWKQLPFKLADLETELTTTVLVARTNPRKEDVLATILDSAANTAGVSIVITPVTAELVAVTYLKAEKTALLATIEAINADILPAPEGQETADVELTAVEEALAGLKGEVARLHDQAGYFAATHLRTLQVDAELLSWERDRYAARAEAKATAYVHIFEGWVHAGKREAVLHSFAAANLSAELVEAEILEDEQPPVEIENHPLLAPFEAVTRLYGMPGHKDLDPTAFLAGFFFLFFGLCLTDVGYGLALVVGSLFILLFTKVADSTRLFAKLLFYIGASTVAIGALFGGYLGIAPEALPAPLQAIQLFDPIGNPLPVFYLALAFGVLQVMVGLLLKIYSDARNGQLLAGVLDQGPWLLMFAIGILYVLTTVGYVSVLSVDQISNLAIVTAALIVLAAGRNGEGIIGKVIAAFLGLYAGVGFLSDILSYSRLLALGLATSALAFAVNLIASMVIGVPYIGFVLAAAIFLIGHAFTLIINTLGAFIHSARLQFVEFFSKFIVGTGKEFTPLSRSEKYVTVGDD